MFELISAIFFSISANIDNVVIGISYGIKKIHISLFKIFLICCITSVITFFSMYVGQNISIFFDVKLANIIGASSLIIIGIIPLVKKLFLRKHFRKDSRNYSCYIENRNINVKEIFTTIINLSINNIAAGIAASITGINILCTTIGTLIFGSIFLYIGNNLGKRINNKLIEKYSEYIASLILIFIGILELFI